MYTIGLDVSLHSTGFAVFKNDDVIHTSVLDGSCVDMLTTVITKLNTAFSNVGDSNNITVVVEDYTDSILSADRTNTASSLIGLKDSIVGFVKSKCVNVSLVLPWSWRKCYGLSTRVLPRLEVDWKLSRACGHNILKDESIALMQRNYKRFGILEAYATNLSDDEIEAILIAKSFLITGLDINRVGYDNIRYVTTEELEHYKTTLPASVNKAKVWR